MRLYHPRWKFFNTIGILAITFVFQPRLSAFVPQKRGGLMAEIWWDEVARFFLFFFALGLILGINLALHLKGVRKFKTALRIGLYMGVATLLSCLLLLFVFSIPALVIGMAAIYFVPNSTLGLPILFFATAYMVGVGMGAAAHLAFSISLSLDPVTTKTTEIFFRRAFSIAAVLFTLTRLIGGFFIFSDVNPLSGEITNMPMYIATLVFTGLVTASAFNLHLFPVVSYIQRLESEILKSRQLDPYTSSWR